MSNLVYQVPLECSRGTDGRTVIRPSEGKYPPSHPLGRLCPSSSTSSGYFSRTLREVLQERQTLGWFCPKSRSFECRACGRPWSTGSDRHLSWYRSSLRT